MVKLRSPVNGRNPTGKPSSYFDPVKGRSQTPKPYVDPVKSRDVYKLEPYQDRTVIRRATPEPYKDPLRSYDNNSKPKANRAKQPQPKPENKPPTTQRNNPSPRKEDTGTYRNDHPPPKPPPQKQASTTRAPQKKAKEPSPVRQPPKKIPKKKDIDDPLTRQRAYETNGPYEDPLKRAPILVLGGTSNKKNYLSYKDEPYVDPLPGKDGQKRPRKPKETEKKTPVREPSKKEQKSQPKAQPKPETPPKDKRAETPKAKRTATPKAERAETPKAVFIAPVAASNPTPQTNKKKLIHSSTQYQPTPQRSMDTQTDVPNNRSFATQSDIKTTKTFAGQTDFTPLPPVIAPVVDESKASKKVPTRTTSVQCEPLLKAPLMTSVTQTSPFIFDHPAPLAVVGRSKTPEYKEQEPIQQTVYNTYNTYETKRRSPSPSVIVAPVGYGRQNRSPTPQQYRHPSPQQQHRTPIPPQNQRHPTPSPHPLYEEPVSQGMVENRAHTPIFTPQPTPYNAPPNSPPRYSARTEESKPAMASVIDQAPVRHQTPYQVRKDANPVIEENQKNVFARTSPQKAMTSPFPYFSKGKLPPEISMYIEAYDTVRMPGSSLGSIQRSMKLA